MTFIRYIGVDFTFGLLYCVRYSEDFVSYIEVRYIEALCLTFYCNFARAGEYRSLYRALPYIEVR